MARHPISQYVARLAAATEAALAGDCASLPSAAFAALTATPPPTVGPRELLAWVAGDLSLPPQADPAANFGQPPITIFESERFSIDINIWRDAATSIHQHAFEGAFMLLHGQAIHARWDFDLEEQLADRVQVGELRRRPSELLRVADVRSIVAGPSFVHSVYHVSSPTISIVVRGERMPELDPQYRYDPGGLAFDPFFNSPVGLRRRQLLPLFRESKPDGRLLAHIAEVSEPIDSIHFLRDLAPMFSAVDVSSYLDAAFPLRRARAAVVLALQHDQVTRTVRRLRGRYHDDATRLVLGGLLLRLSRRELTQLFDAAGASRNTHEVGALLTRLALDLGLDDGLVRRMVEPPGDGSDVDRSSVPLLFRSLVVASGD